jgi:hypothetical protein
MVGSDILGPSVECDDCVVSMSTSGGTGRARDVFVVGWRRRILVNRFPW